MTSTPDTDAERPDDSGPPHEGPVAEGLAAGNLVVEIADRSVEVSMVGGSDWTLPVGPLSLVNEQLERADRPAPEQLTNALGIVIDHLDDVLRESPIVRAAEHVVFTGRHATTMAAVELGADTVPAGYMLQRSDADEVFRTLVAETSDERAHNPGLPPEAIDSIIGTCCVVLAVMRSLELDSAAIAPAAGGA